MLTAGIDIGSRFIKFVALDDEQLVMTRRLDTGYAPREVCMALLDEVRPQSFVTTGYGRQLLETLDGVRIVTEIKAVAVGARHTRSGCGSVVDIGGQDTKVIAIGPSGRVTSFEMNDRCAAGTGRFLEVMAKTLDFSLDELGTLSGDTDIVINSLCTVFAESEVISLIARGVPREEIGLAVQRLIAAKVSAMAKRLDLQDEVMFTGGCAFNQCLRRLIEADLGRPLHVSAQSHLLAAYGAALLAAQPTS